jgi:hypothetical protein
LREECAVINRIRDALGSFAGSILGLAIIAALIVLPVFVVLWTGSALGVPWAIAAQYRLAVGLDAAITAANTVLPAWAWFAIIALLWLAFIDVHVRYLVRDELSKHLKAHNERELP